MGIEAIDSRAWKLAQEGLRSLLAEPRLLAEQEPSAFAALMAGLIRSGLAMQAVRSSRPASGAEHQFSHLWDMDGWGLNHPHGFKVGIGTLASAALYEQLLTEDVAGWDIPAMIRERHQRGEPESRLVLWHGAGAVLDLASSECAAKPATLETMMQRFERLRGSWGSVQERLRTQLLPAQELRRMLKEAGAPSTHEEIGATTAVVRASYRRAMTIRRRYTILDLAEESGRMDEWLGRIL